MTIKNFNSCKETHPFFNKDKMSVVEILFPSLYMAQDLR